MSATRATGSAHPVGTPRRHEDVASSSREGAAATRLVAVGVSLALLLLVSLAGTNAARPPLGDRGWAPGSLPWTPSSAGVTVLLATAYVLGGVAVVLGLWRPPTRAWPWPPLLGVGALVLLGSPIGSADHTNYAAYGRIAVMGGDPYLVAPDAFAGGNDPVAGAVEPPWSGTTSVYGPFATLLQALCSVVGGDSMRQTVWAWQLVVVVAWLGARWLLLRTGAAPGRIDVLWTANPVIVGVGVLGAHVDLLAAALVVAAFAVLRRSPLAAGALAGLALCSKVTVGVALLGIVVGLLADRRVRSAAMALLGAAIATGPLYLWAGPHVVEQLDRAKHAVSLATPWRLLLERTIDSLGGYDARRLVFWLSALVCVVLAGLLWRATRGLLPVGPVGMAARITLVLTAAYALGTYYSLPWYDLVVWAVLPLAAASALDHVLVLRSVVMAVAYVPGRVVGLSVQVEKSTLWFRQRVAPWAVLASWGAVLVLGLLRRNPPPRDLRQSGSAVPSGDARV